MANGLPGYTATETIAPQPVVNAPASGIGDAVTRLGAALSDAAGGYARGQAAESDQRIFEAQQKAQSTAVYTDDAGVVRTQPLPAPDSPENRAYINTAQTIYTAQVSQAAKAQAMLLREQHQYDPAGFQSAWSEFESKELAGAPSAWVEPTRRVISQHGTDGYTALQIAAMNRDDSLAQQSWKSQLSDTENRLQALHEAGQFQDDRTTALVAQREALLNTAVERRWMDPTGADIYRQSAASQATAAGVSNIALGEAVSKLQTGMPKAEAYQFGRDRVEKYLNSPDLAGLSLRDREAVRDKYDERFREHTAIMATQTTAISDDLKAKVDGLQRGMDVSPADFAQLRQQFLQNGDTDKAAEASLWAGVAADIQPMLKRPIADLQAGLAAAQKGEVTPVTMRYMASLEHVIGLRQKEAAPEVANLQQELQAVAKGVELGQPTPLDHLTDIAKRMGELGQAERSADLLRTVDAARAAQDAGKDPLPVLQDKLETLRAQPPGVDTTAHVAALQEMVNKKIAGMREDPMGYGAQLHRKEVGPLTPVNWADAADPEKASGLIATLKERTRQASMLGNLEPGVDITPLTKSEMGSLRNVLQVASADQKVALAASMNDGLGETGIAALSPHMFREGNPDSRTFGIAAEIAGKRPEVARAIFIGNDILQGRGVEKVSTMPKAEDMRIAMQTNLYPVFDQFSGQDPTEARQQINLPAVYERFSATGDAVSAYYAYLARGTESPDQKTLMKQAVDAVTGGVLDGPQGYKVFAPRPGMSQSEFDRVWSGLNQADFGPIAPTTVTKESLTLQDIKDRGILRSIGDGEYEVWMSGGSGNLFQLYRPGAPQVDPKNAPGMIAPGTITNLYNRPSLKNADGSISTTRSMSIGADMGETLIPTVVDGKSLTPDQAVERFRKTGEHLGVFDTPEHADAYAIALHNDQAERMGLNPATPVIINLRDKQPEYRDRFALPVNNSNLPALRDAMRKQWELDR